MGMHIHLPHKDSARRLPRAIQEYMRFRFKLTTEYLELLRCFEYSGEVGGRQVRRFSIFSPGDAAEQVRVIKTRDDILRSPGILLFEGYIDRQGKAYVADRRNPKRRQKSTQPDGEKK